MEIRVLEYFLAIVNEGGMNKAAESLHITQPTLSRQIAHLEEEIDAPLFIRDGHKLILTNEGLLLKRRAEEIINLVKKTGNELKEGDREGSIVIGCGELEANNDFIKVVERFKEKYPLVKFEFIVANADASIEAMEQGNIDISILLEPIDLENYNFIRLKDKEEWCLLMNNEDQLAHKENITISDLKDNHIILPKRLSVRNELQNILGHINETYTSNLTSIDAMLVKHNVAKAIVLKGTASLFDPSIFKVKTFNPPIYNNSVIVWKKNQTHSYIMRKFIEELMLLKY